MTEKLKKLIENFVEGDKTEIKQKLMRLLFASNFLTFLTLIIISLFGIFACWSIIGYQNERLSSSTADYTEEFLKDEITTQLKRTVTAKSTQINEILISIHHDTEIIANKMTAISMYPYNYTEKILTNSRAGTLYSGVPYVHYGTELFNNGISEQIAEKIKMDSNVAETLIEIGKFYTDCDTSVFIGTKENYLICVDNVYSGDKIVQTTDDYFNDYEIPKTIWYKTAKDSPKVEFTEIYKSEVGNINGNFRLACAKAYKDAENNFAGVVAVDFPLEEIFDTMFYRTQSKENISFVIDKNGKIISTSLNEGFFKFGTKFDSPEIVEKMKAGENDVELISIDGKEYYIAFAPIEVSGWSYASLIDHEKIIAPAKVAKIKVEEQVADLNALLNSFFYRLSFAILIMSIIALMLLRLFSQKQTKKFVAPILELSDGIKDITSSNFDKKLEIHTNDEIEHLAVCFNAMTDELKNYMENLKQVTANKERIATELQIAENIQSSMLPRNFNFGRSDFEIYATMNAAKEVGGDFYDFYLLDENNLVITMADVSGKGVSAALFMVVSKTILKNFSMTMKSSVDLAAAVTCTNQQLCKNNDEMLFVTIFTGILDLQTGKLTYVNAAHESLLLYSSQNDEFKYIKSAKRNYSLGLMDDVEYEAEEVQLGPGDIIFQYTDGVTEAMNENRKLFGDERLLNTLNELHAKKIPVKEILNGVKKSIASFVKSAPQSDDITMIGVRYK